MFSTLTPLQKIIQDAENAYNKEYGPDALGKYSATEVYKKAQLLKQSTTPATNLLEDLGGDISPNFELMLENWNKKQQQQYVQQEQQQQQSLQLLRQESIVAPNLDDIFNDLFNFFKENGAARPVNLYGEFIDVGCSAHLDLKKIILVDMDDTIEKRNKVIRLLLRCIIELTKVMDGTSDKSKSTKTLSRYKLIESLYYDISNNVIHDNVIDEIFESDYINYLPEVSVGTKILIKGGALYAIIYHMFNNILYRPSPRPRPRLRHHPYPRPNQRKSTPLQTAFADFEKNFEIGDFDFDYSFDNCYIDKEIPRFFLLRARSYCKKEEPQNGDIKDLYDELKRLNDYNIFKNVISFLKQEEVIRSTGKIPLEHLVSSKLQNCKDILVALSVMDLTLAEKNDEIELTKNIILSIIYIFSQYFERRIVKMRTQINAIYISLKLFKSRLPVWNPVWDLEFEFCKFYTLSEMKNLTFIEKWKQNSKVDQIQMFINANLVIAQKLNEVLSRKSPAGIQQIENNVSNWLKKKLSSNDTNLRGDMCRHIVTFRDIIYNTMCDTINELNSEHKLNLNCGNNKPIDRLSYSYDGQFVYPCKGTSYFTTSENKPSNIYKNSQKCIAYNSVMLAKPQGEIKGEIKGLTYDDVVEKLNNEARGISNITLEQNSAEKDVESGKKYIDTTTLTDEKNQLDDMIKVAGENSWYFNRFARLLRSAGIPLISSGGKKTKNKKQTRKKQIKRKQTRKKTNKKKTNKNKNKNKTKKNKKQIKRKKQTRKR